MVSSEINRGSLDKANDVVTVNCDTLVFWWAHADVIKWKHFPRYWPFLRGIHKSHVNSQHKRQWRGALMFSLICAWMDSWVNKLNVGDLRRHCAHYDVTVMEKMLRWIDLKRVWYCCDSFEGAHFSCRVDPRHLHHYDDVIMTMMGSQITSLTVVYSTVYSDTDQRKHQNSASLAFVWGIHRDRWIPRTKGQLRGKCFHLMTSSWIWSSRV